MSKQLKWETSQDAEYGKTISTRFDLNSSNKIRELSEKYKLKQSTIVRRIVKDYFDNDYEEN